MSRNSCFALIAALVLGVSGVAHADSFFFRSRGIPVAAPEQQPENPGENPEPAPIVIAPISPLTIAMVGEEFSLSLSASGGSGAITWSLSEGELPAGLSLRGSQISGVLTADGEYSFSLAAVDNSGNSAVSNPVAVSVDRKLSITPLYRTFTRSQPGNLPLAAQGGRGAYDWSITSGTLPDGISLSSSGNLSGTASSVSASSIIVQVTDSIGRSARSSMNIRVVDPLSKVLATSLPSQVSVGSNIPYTFNAVGGAQPYSWSISGLPGVSIGSDGALSGNVTSQGNFTFTVSVSDPDGRTDSRIYSIEVTPQPAATLTLPNGWEIRFPTWVSLPTRVTQMQGSRFSAGGAYWIYLTGTGTCGTYRVYYSFPLTSNPGRRVSPTNSGGSGCSSFTQASGRAATEAVLVNPGANTDVSARAAVWSMK